MLSGTLALHDVRDAGALVSSIVSTSRLQLTWTEREDLEAFLLATAWELSTRYEPGGSVTFSTWATTTLRLRQVDWLRKERGRSRWRFGDGTVHERERPPVESLDERRERGVDDDLGAGTGDPQNGCDPDFARVLAGGGRTRARDLETLGLRPARRAR